MFGGGERDRTDDLRSASATLSQLSYTPSKSVSLKYGHRRQKSNQRIVKIGMSMIGALCVFLKKLILTKLVGLGRLELPTSRLSGVRSNQLSYRPL